MNGLPGEERILASFETLADEIKRYYKKGYRALGFLGGEPTIHPKIIELVSLANQLGYENIDIVSNGRMYHNRAFVEKLIKSGVTRFYISIHSHKPDIEDYLTQKNGSFKQKIEGLKNLMDLRKKGFFKDRIFLNTVINKSNYLYLTDFMHFYHKMGFMDFRFNFIRPDGRAYLHGKKMVPRYSTVMKYVKQAIELSKSLRVNVFFEGIPFCLFHRSEIRDFKNYIGEFRDGNKKISLGEAQKRIRFEWKERRKNELRTKEETCNPCVYNPVCEGPWKNYIQFYGFKEFRPVKKEVLHTDRSDKKLNSYSYSLHRSRSKRR
ncbi:MAG: radical SAM protein [Spirochaetes bacterium]|nr:radical SAM protein [Spirochaetota bacterium]